MSDARPDRARLAQLLKAAGSTLDVAAVEALIAGVLAAPAEIGASWHALVAEPPPAELADALETLKAQLAAGHSDGVQAEDFARMPRGERLMLLREKLAADCLAGFIVPRADEHQGEYVPLCGQRLAWLTGFTGSAGAGGGAGRSARRSLSMAATHCRPPRRSIPICSKSTT